MRKSKSTKRKEIDAMLYQLITSSYVLENIKFMILEKKLKDENIIITITCKKSQV